MSPSIEIDDDVMDFLKSRAEPFVDTPNSVLRRMLGIGGSPQRSRDASDEPQFNGSTPRAERKPVRQKSAARKSTGRTRAASGTLLPEDDYMLPLLHALDAADGEAPYRDVLNAVGEDIHDRLMPADFEELASGGIRWHSRLQFVRLRLIERGDLDRNAPRGTWRITDAGRETLQSGMTQ